MGFRTVFLIFVALIAINPNAQAYESRDNDDAGIAAATKQCDRIMDTNLKLKCLQGVSRAEEMNENAVKQCARLNHSGLLADCIVAASGPADDEAVEQCARFNEPSAIVTCMRNIVGKTYRSSDIAQCGRYMYVSDINNCLGQLGRPVRRHRNCRD